MMRAMIGRDQTLGFIAGEVLLIVPILLIMAGTWCTVTSLYTLPFRSGRGGFLTSLLMAWWDAGRCIWLFWTGMVRVVVALVGWVIGSVRFASPHDQGRLIVGLVRSPITLLQNSSSRRYFQPGVPWVAFLILIALVRDRSDDLYLHAAADAEEVFGSLTGSIRIRG